MLRKAILNTFYYTGAQAFLRPYLGGMGSILMLHHVRDVPKKPFDPNYHLSIAPEFLDVMLDEIGRTYDFVSMDEVSERLDRKVSRNGGRPFVAITLDDGYRDNFENALPIFEKHQVPFTIFVAPQMVEGLSRIWWEDLEAVISILDHLQVSIGDVQRKFRCETAHGKTRTYDTLMDAFFAETDEADQRDLISQMCAQHGIDDKAHLLAQIADWPMIQEIAKNPLCTIGAHGMNHLVSSKLSDQTLRWELKQSKQILEDKLGCPVNHLAFPYGYVEAAGPRDFQIARECEFETAVTTRHGVIYPQHSHHMTALPRVSINGFHQSMRYITTLLSGVPTRLKNYGTALDVA